MAWGDNSDGQLGDDTTTDSDVPVPVSGLVDATNVKAGEDFSMALFDYGTVVEWGDNSDGQLGDGTTTDSDVPVRATEVGTHVRSIRAGSDFAVALVANQTVWAWGDNSDGQLGNGTTTDSAVPVPVSGLSFIKGIAAGGSHALALQKGGTVAAWGDNSDGQLGDGTTTGSDVPVPVTGLRHARAIAAGGSHSLALLSGGVWAWGDNSDGQLGNGTTTDSDVPVPVTGLSGVLSISAGGAFSMAHIRNWSPTLPSTGRTAVRVGSPFSKTFRVKSHPAVAAFSETGSIPTGVTFVDNHNDTATLSGTPTTSGTYPLTVTASNGVGSPSNEAFRLVVTPLSSSRAHERHRR
jgi:alpha-tubulin suppressor-like RCC1 family protein